MRRIYQRKAPVESLCLIQTLSWLLPRDYDDRWRREWSAEAWHWLNEQTGKSADFDWSTRLRLFGHVTGAIADVWFLLIHERFLREKLACIGRGAFGGSGALGLVIAILWPFCVERAVICPFRDSQHAVLLARRNPFLGKLDGLSTAELDFLSHRKDVFEDVGRWRTHLVPVKNLGVTATVLELDGTARQLFALRLSSGRWPTGGSGCEVATAAFVVSSQKILNTKKILNLNGLPCRVVGVVSRPDTAAPDFTLLESAQSLTKEDLTNAVARLRSDVSEWKLNRTLDVPFDATKPWLRSGNSLVVTPIETLRAAPLKWGGIVFLSLCVIAAFCRKAYSFRARLVSLLETALMLIAIAIPWFYWLANLPVFNGLNLGLAMAVYAYPIFFGSLATALMLRLQKQSCRVCRRRLVSPVRIGHYGCVLMESAGRESVCVEGHGSLFESADVTPACSWLKWA